MRTRYFGFIVLLLMGSRLPAKQAPTIPFPCQWPGSPGFTPQANWDRQNIIDPSGICFHPQRKTFFIVSDSDNLFVEITLDGKLVKEYAVPGNDQEGIAWDDQGHIFICQESGGILKLMDLRKR